MGLVSVLKSSHALPIKALLVFDLSHLLLRALIYRISRKMQRQVYLYSSQQYLFIQNPVAALYIFNEIYCRETYMLPSALQQKDLVIYDCGANIGLATLWFTWRYPQAHIIAFEPSSETHELLMENITRNHIKNCTVYKIALSEKKGNTTFFTVHDPIQVLGSGLHKPQSYRYHEEVVSTNPLSRYLTAPVYYLKMDIESAEYDVINELVQTNTLRHISHMVLEVHFPAQYKQKYTSLLSQLRKQGKAETLRTGSFSVLLRWTNKNAPKQRSV